MKSILIRTFSLAAMVGMTAVLANAVRAEGSALEGAKQESGVEFGEMGGLKARGGSSAVSASGDGVSRSALTLGKLDMKVKGRPQVPSPAPASKSNGGESGLLKFGKLAVGIPAAALGAVVGFVGGTLVAAAVAVLTLGSLGGAVFIAAADRGGAQKFLGLLAAPITWAVKAGRAGYKAVGEAFKG